LSDGLRPKRASNPSSAPAPRPVNPGGAERCCCCCRELPEKQDTHRYGATCTLFPRTQLAALGSDANMLSSSHTCEADRVALNKRGGVGQSLTVSGVCLKTRAACISWKSHQMCICCIFYIYRLCRSKVWGHPENVAFSMKTLTFIGQMNCKMNIKYSQDIDTVRNNDFYCKYECSSSCRSKEGQFYSFSHQNNCFQLRSHKKGF